MCKSKECQNKTSEKFVPIYSCKLCKAMFTFEECLEMHERIWAKGKKRCEKCNKLLPEKRFTSDGAHPNCGLRYCRMCKIYADPENHPFCYVQPYISKLKPSNKEMLEDKEETVLDLLSGYPEDYDEEYLEAQEKAEVEAAEKIEKTKQSCTIVTQRLNLPIWAYMK